MGVWLLNNIEKAYFNHEVAKMLDIGESTLRKWCIALEKNGYNFVKGSKDSRAFTERDINVLRTFKMFLNEKKRNRDEAAKAVIEMYGNTQGNERTTPVLYENDPSIKDLQEKVDKLLEMNNKQHEFNIKLLERLEQQNQYINELIEKRDRLLLESIRNSQNEKKKLVNRIKNIFKKNNQDL